MGERADAIAHVLQHEHDANLHRCFMACREFSTQLANALLALSAETRKKIRAA
jgi:hypothetical protein